MEEPKLEHSELIIKDEIMEQEEQPLLCDQLHQEIKEHHEDELLKIKMETSTYSLDEETGNLHRNEDFQACWIKEEETDQFEKEENNVTIAGCSNANTLLKRRQSYKKFVCDFCSQSFTNRTKLKLHLNHHAGERSLPCTECDRVFVKCDNLRKHLMRTHSIMLTYDCTYCEETFTCIKDINDHIRKEHKQLTCCGLWFKTDYRTCRNDSFRDHVTTFHTGDMPFKCDICGEFYAKYNTFQSHKKSHVTEEVFFNCKICSKSFADSKNLEYHLNTHAKLLYKCDRCEKSFRNPNALRTHVRHHAGIPHACVFCNQKFQRFGDYNQHVITAHKNLRQYHCNTCNKSFQHRNNFETHQQMHTMDVSYKCNCCNKAFAEKKLLKSHRLLHSSYRRTFKCDQCDSRFKKKSTLMGHKHTCHSQ